MFWRFGLAVVLASDEIAALREQLLKQQRELEEAADVLAEAGRPLELDQASVGRLSRMDAMQAPQA